MKTRLIGAAVALVLAVAGTVVVGAYVSGAESRAYAGTRTREVLVVAEPVPEGTTAAALAKKVRLEALPAKAVAADSVTKVEELADRVASADLVPGEQVLSSRFVAPKTLAERGGETAVPKGMQQLTVELSPERVVGGTLEPGDTVGVYISAEPPASPGHSTTHAFHAVLVTDVQGGTSSTSESESTDDAAASTATTSTPPSSTETVLVTVAVRAADAEDIVWGKEFGRLWLTLEPKDADDAGTKVTTVKDVMK